MIADSDSASVDDSVETEEEDTSSVSSSGDIREPFDPNKIRVRPWTPTVYNLMERLKHGELDLSPEFQRRAGVWSVQKQSRLIESLLMRIPLPSFYLDELPPKESDPPDRYSVVDGVQRLFVLDKFINEKTLRLTGLEFLKLSGQGIDDLSPSFRRRILEAQLSVNVVEYGTPDEAKLNIFRRINTGGVPLTAQEIRHAMSPQVVRQWLKDAAEIPDFRRALGSGAERLAVRMQDRECIARFVAFIDDGVSKYRASNGDLDAFLLRSMKEIVTMDRAALQQRLHRSMIAAHEILGGLAFRKYDKYTSRRGPVNKALFEATAVALDQRTDEDLAALIAQRQKVVPIYIEQVNSFQLNDAISVGTGDPRRVEHRFSAMQEVFAKALV
jgi:hypothetical protein